MVKSKYRVNVHFEGCVDIEVDATDEEQAEEIAKEKFREMSAEYLVGFCEENLDADYEVQET